MLKDFGFTIIVQMLSIILGIGLALAMSLIFDATGRSLSWFSSTWLAFGLYLSPMLFGLAIGPASYVTIKKRQYYNDLKQNNFDFAHGLTLNMHIQLFLHAQGLLLATITIVLTAYEILSAYIFLFALIFYSVTSLITTVINISNIRFKSKHYYIF